ARSTQSHSWLSDTLRTQRSNLRSAERKWHKSAALDDLASYQTLLASFSSSITAAKKTFFYDKINGATDARKLFSTFKTLLSPPPPPQLLTSLLITLLPFSQRKWQPSGNSSTNCLPPLRAQPSMAHHFLLSPLSARVRSPKS